MDIGAAHTYCLPKIAYAHAYSLLGAAHANCLPKIAYSHAYPLRGDAHANNRKLYGSF